MRSRSFYSALARSILSGDADYQSIVARAGHTLGRNWKWLGPLIRRYREAFDADSLPRRKDVAKFLADDEGLRDAIYRYGNEVRIAHWINQPARMRPAHAARDWHVPAIESIGALAEWLQVSACELKWFANLRRLKTRGTNDYASDPLDHYHYQVHAKSSGGIRLLECPKKTLKTIQV